MTPSTSAIPTMTMNRDIAIRGDRDALQRARRDPRTRILAVVEDLIPLDEAGGVRWVAEAELSTAAIEWAYLGEFSDGRPALAAAYPSGEFPFGSPEQWHAFRTVAGALSESEATAAVSAVSIGRWLLTARYCSMCGTETEVTGAGWSRSCPNCASEHFPRTDPAVIVAVESEDRTRLLLGTNIAWRDRNVYSCFAGFVEAGESLEDTILREIREEAGVRVSNLRYRASQAWPYPRSLMVGFHATAVDDAEAEPDGDEIVAVRWFSRTEIVAALAGDGEVNLPGPSSIARRLIADWCARTP